MEGGLVKENNAHEVGATSDGGGLPDFRDAPMRTEVGAYS